MKRGLDIHFGAVIVGVFVDQIGSFAMGAAIAMVAIGAAGKGGLEGDERRGNLIQALYEASCIVFGVIGGYTAARLARQSMVARGVAVEPRQPLRLDGARHRHEPGDVRSPPAASSSPASRSSPARSAAGWPRCSSQASRIAWPSSLTSGPAERPLLDCDRTWPHRPMSRCERLISRRRSARSSPRFTSPSRSNQHQSSCSSSQQ